MTIFIILFCIALLVILITVFKINAFISFLIVSVTTGLLLGMSPAVIPAAIQKGLGDMLGQIVIVIVLGAMLGKLVAESGAAQQIATGMMNLFGAKNVKWALVVTGFIIGIPLFYNVAFVLVIPLIFSIAHQYKLPVIATGVPMMASLSVTHGFLPPHPSPTALLSDFHADMGTTLFYGVIVAIPTVILAGPVFSRTVTKIIAKPLGTFTASVHQGERLPSLKNSILSSLSPVILLGITTFFKYQLSNEYVIEGIRRITTLVRVFNPKITDEAGMTAFTQVVSFFSEPSIILLLSLCVATYSLGLRLKMSITKVMTIYSESVKDITILLLIIGGAGCLKEILVQSGASDQLAASLKGMRIDPLFLGWLVAAFIRVCLGSATVAGITTARIIGPIALAHGVNPELMVLAIGAGSMMFSHVNDTGFWLFKEYFNLSIKDTIRSWSLMETIVAIVGIISIFGLKLVLEAGEWI